MCKEFWTLVVLLLSACIKFQGNNDVGDLTEPLGITTKSDSQAAMSDTFSFMVTENDVRVFIQNQQPQRQIRSLETVKRNGLPMFYVVNFTKGWVICPADKHLPPIVAESEEGVFDLNMLDHSGVIGWLHELQDAITIIRQEPSMMDTANENTFVWEGKPISNNEIIVDTISRSSLYTWTKIPVSQIVYADSVKRVGPYLTTKWGQSFPWNEKLPTYDNGNNHYPTGCVAVAVSQLLYYYHYAVGAPSGLYHDITISGWTYYPASGDTTAHYKSTLTRANFTYNSSRWDQMILRGDEYNIYFPSSILGANYVSDLMVDVGNRVEMRYDANGDGAGSDILKAQAALPYYGLNGTFGSFGAAPVIANLDQQRPLYMTGYDTEDDIGHAWVVDGYKSYRQIYLITYEWIQGYMYGEFPNGEPATDDEAVAAATAEGYDKPEDGMITHEFSCGIPYSLKYHFNWGNDGLSNGYYYNLSSLTVGDYQYTSNQDVLYNIHN